MPETQKVQSRQLVDRPYITRDVFVHPEYAKPGVQDAARWRLVAAEPINKMARRMIQREISSLNYTFTPENPKDQQQVDASKWYEGVYKDFRNLVNRTLKSVCELPQGGAWEVGRMDAAYGEGGQGTLTFVQFIDAGTLYPTVDDTFPIVQIHPQNTLERVNFREGEIVRVLAWPRDEFDRQWWQESPTEASYLAIEALSRIYVYSLKQLMDTPVAGILDMMDFSEEDAVNWAKTFREMLEGIDPIKIPILYGHTEAAKWLPMGNSFAALAIPEQFRLYADMVLGNYGLSIGDLRIFEHSDTKAGSAVSRKITMQQGVDFYAELIKDAVQSTLPPFIIFEWEQSDLEDARTKAQIATTQARTIQTFNFIPPYKKYEQAKKWKVLDVDLTEKELEDYLATLVPQEAGGPSTGLPTPRPGQLEEGEGRVRDFLEDDAKTNAATGTRIFAKAYQEAQGLIEKAVSRFKQNFPVDGRYGRKKQKAAERLERILSTAFRKAAKQTPSEVIALLLDKVYTQFPDLVMSVSGQPMEAKALLWDRFLTNLIVGEDVYVEKQGDQRARIEVLLDELLAEADFYAIADKELYAMIMEVLSLAYEDGLLSVAELAQGNLHARGKVPSPAVKLAFNLVDPKVVQFLEDYAADMVRHIDEGTKYFLRRMITEGALEGWDAENLTAAIHRNLYGLPPEEAGQLYWTRIRSIVNTELNMADTYGRLKQMEEIGLKLKRWVTRKIDVCPLCLRNEALGSVPLDYGYENVFPGETTLGPPGHPSTCHCSIAADMEELNNLGFAPEYWTGGSERKADLSEKYDPDPNRYPKGHYLGGHFAPKDGKGSVSNAGLSKTPQELEGLIAEARKYDNFKEFSRDYSIHGLRGQYWHITDSKSFDINRSYIPKDMSSISVEGGESGLMVTGDIEGWEEIFSGRPYAAEIDLSDAVKGEDFTVVNRGFGHEIFIHNTNKVRVVRTIPLSNAIRLSRRHEELIPQSEEALRELWENARGHKEKYNPYHEPAGKPEGGRFASQTGTKASPKTGNGKRGNGKSNDFSEAQARLTSQIDVLSEQYADIYKAYFDTDDEKEADLLESQLTAIDKLRDALIAQREQNKDEIFDLAVESILKEDPSQGEKLMGAFEKLESMNLGDYAQAAKKLGQFVKAAVGKVLWRH